MDSSDYLHTTENPSEEEARKLNSLGLLPAAGFGVPQDHQIALLYFKKTAQVEPMPYRIL